MKHLLHQLRTGLIVVTIVTKAAIAFAGPGIPMPVLPTTTCGSGHWSVGFMGCCPYLEWVSTC